ncbi:MAG: rRNA maturation RNase YbeY [Candidatus Rhabdochlamydia oedothoracis]|nr:rRNA maturation RNase YbeY [Candidatus Rhabdochlamydia oedothoracis]
MVFFLFELLQIKTDEISIQFVSEKRISQLHALFFQNPAPTDCITFPIDSIPYKRNGYHLLGEIFICPKMAKQYAKKYQINPFEELCRYVVHGILHLIGFEDEKPDLRAQMKRKENACLKCLKQKGLLALD